MKKMVLLVVALTLLAVFPVEAHTPKGGLGDAAISPDGKILVAGGDSRVLYVIDPSSLEVKDRIWLKTSIYEMEFNKDGSVLVVEDTAETLHFINTKDWKVAKTVKKGGPFSAAPMVDILAGYTSGYKESSINFYSMTDGSSKGKIEYPGKIISVGIDAQGKRVVMLAQGPKDTEEKKQTPKDLKDIEKETFKQKNDGKVSVLAEFEVPSGKKISEKTIFYSANSPIIIVTDKRTLIINYGNVNANIEGDAITLFRGESSYNYGMEVSADRKTFLLGGLRDGTRGTSADLNMTTFNIDRLPGWPEYFKGFGFAQDGTGYGVTTAYRLVKIGQDGSVVKAVPIY